MFLEATTARYELLLISRMPLIQLTVFHTQENKFVT